MTGRTELGAPGPGLRIDYVRVAADLAVPRLFAVTFEGAEDKSVDLTVGVGLDGVTVCTEVTVRADPTGEALRSDDLKVPLRRLMDIAVEHLARPAEFDGSGGIVRIGSRAPDVGSAPARRRPPRAWSPEDLMRVARIFRAARATPASKRIGRPRPTQAVADEMTAGVYSTAAKLVARARDAGYLEGGQRDRTRNSGSLRFGTEKPTRSRRGTTAPSPFVPQPSTSSGED